MNWFNLAMALRPIFMVWVVVLVTGGLLWYCRPRRGAKFRDYARIPFNDDRQP